MIWKHEPSIEGINAISPKTLVDALGITFTRFGDDFLEAQMPVDHRTKQPAGMLHGGASAALAETVGSVASIFCLEDMSAQLPVGVELNANHLNSATSGTVTARATPFKIGRSIHVWHIEIRDEQQKLICVSRLTIAVVDRRK